MEISLGLIQIVPYFVARGSRNTRAPCTALGTARAPGEKPKTLVGSAAAGPFGQGLLCRLEPWLWLSSACWWCVHLQHRPALLPSHPQLRDHPNGGGGAIEPPGCPAALSCSHPLSSQGIERLHCSQPRSPRVRSVLVSKPFGNRLWQRWRIGAVLQPSSPSPGTLPLQAI